MGISFVQTIGVYGGCMLVVLAHRVMYDMIRARRARLEIKKLYEKMPRSG